MENRKKVYTNKAWREKKSFDLKTSWTLILKYIKNTHIVLKKAWFIY